MAAADLAHETVVADPVRQVDSGRGGVFGLDCSDNRAIQVGRGIRLHLQERLDFRLQVDVAATRIVQQAHTVLSRRVPSGVKQILTRRWKSSLMAANG
jgi:hypothetical protein